MIKGIKKKKKMKDGEVTGQYEKETIRLKKEN